MKIEIFNSYSDLCSKAETIMRFSIERKATPLLCLAAGHSSYGVFDCMKKKKASGYKKYNECNYIGLDEWGGLTRGDDGSMRDFMDKNYFTPMEIEEDRVCFPDGAKNLDSECSRIDSYLKEEGPIDFILLGLGLSGHVALNEPGVDLNNKTHVTSLNDVTRNSMNKFFENPKPIEQGITLGLSDITSARSGVLVVSGEAKASILKKMLTDEIGNSCPASVLRNYPQFILMADKQAAKFLNR